MSETEPLIRQLEDIFGQRNAKVLKTLHGVKGAILIGLSKDELVTIAESKGYETGGFDPFPSEGFGMYWAYPNKEGENVLPAVVFYTKHMANRKAVYVLNDEFERFKEVFLEQ